MSEVDRISAVTLVIKNMERSCSFYSQIPGLSLHTVELRMILLPHIRLAGTIILRF
jgi:hypothetical protein